MKNILKAIARIILRDELTMLQAQLVAAETSAEHQGLLLLACTQELRNQRIICSGLRNITHQVINAMLPEVSHFREGGVAEGGRSFA